MLGVGRMGGASDSKCRGRKVRGEYGTSVCSKVASVTLGNSSGFIEEPPHLPGSNATTSVPLQGSVPGGTELELVSKSPVQGSCSAIRRGQQIQKIPLIRTVCLQGTHSKTP